MIFFQQTHSEKLGKVYQPLRTALNAKTVVSVAHLFAAREDLSKIMRTSSGRIREKTACAINKVINVLVIIHQNKTIRHLYVPLFFGAEGPVTAFISLS